MRFLLGILRRYFIAGLMVWVPLGITFLVMRVLIDLMDQSLLLLPRGWRPEALLGMEIPGVGAVLTVLVVFVTGVIAANFLGRKLVSIWERMLSGIPLVRSIYAAVKQVAETIFSSSGEAFRKVLLVEYPRKGIWTIGFQTGNPVGEVQRKTEQEVVTVFIPTTPNPTSGFIIMVPREDVQVLDMPVEDGLKFIMSLGVVNPKERSAVVTEQDTP